MPTLDFGSGPQFTQKKKKTIPPTISHSNNSVEILLESLHKKVDEQIKQMKKLDKEYSSSLLKNVTPLPCKFKPIELPQPKENSLFKIGLIVSSAFLFVIIIFSVFQAYQINNLERYYYLYELRKHYDFSPEKAESLYLDKEELVRLKIDDKNKSKKAVNE